MQSYLFIGGNQDGVNIPVTNDVEFVQLSVGAMGRETYIRDTFAVGAYASITFYRHEELKPEEVLDLLVQHHGAWTYIQPALTVEIRAGAAR